VSRRRRTAALVDLRAPALAVWPGEVVVVAAPDREELRGLLAAVREGAAPLAGTRREARHDRSTGRRGATAGTAAGGGAVVAGVRMCPGSESRQVLAALRTRIARRVPCRCVWLVGGRVYPE
jgi:hypothetical protein